MVAVDELYPTLDLHGETAESGRRRAERWLRESQAMAIPTVRVITGRGRRSQGPPVLRGEIADLLSALKGEVVDSVADEPGGGAFRVELRRPTRAPARPTPPAPRVPADPELRRRAEESLAELGVTPTPELLAAEMRRLSGQG